MKKIKAFTQFIRHHIVPVRLLLAGLLLFVLLYQGEQTAVASWFQDVGRFANRMAFLVVLPFRPFAILLIPQHHHHWTVGHLLLVSFGTPVFYWGIWKLAHWLADRVSSLFHWNEKFSPDRRRFLTNATTGAAAAIATGAGAYATRLTPSQLRVRRYTMPIQGLPAGLDGVRLVHVSDTHYGPFVSLDYLNDAIQAANALHGDLMVLTGDYVHRTPLAVDDGIGMFENLKARYGAVAVLGNHEYWEGSANCRGVFDAINIPVLSNQSLFLTPSGLDTEGRPGRSLCLAGLDDLWEGKVDFDATLARVSDGVPRVVLAHNPDTAEMPNIQQRIDLMLAGHTHGGQVSLPGIGAPVVPSRYGQKYAGGLCQSPMGPVIVSRGVGMAGIPLRIGVPPELGLITLVKA